MQALGLIETKGLIPAIECADVMLKTAQVKLVERTFVGSGLVTIIVTGDVGAVKAAVEAGVTAVERIDPLALISQHIIPRPHPEIESMVGDKAKPVDEPPTPEPPGTKADLPQGANPNAGSHDQMAKENVATEFTEPAAAPGKRTPDSSRMLQHLRKESVDAFAEEFGLEKTITALKMLSVVKLRNLAREYKELDIAGRAISKANKDLLMEKLTAYYRKRLQ